MPEQTTLFLTIPLELRELIYTFIFQPTLTLEIQATTQSTDSSFQESTETAGETTTTSWPSDKEFWGINPHPLTSQLLRINRQLHTETLPFLYSHRRFDLTALDSLKLLLHDIGPTNFRLIRHVTLGWEYLQNLAWDLAKDEYKRGLAGLRCIELATWRPRDMTCSRMQWRTVRGYERMMCQAACDILEKQGQLKILAEEPYRRRGSANAGLSHSKVKWRFVVAEEELREGEVVVDLKGDLEKLGATQDEANDGGFSLSLIDPF